MAAFWYLLGEEMGREDSISNPHAPRQYGGFILVMLLNRTNGHEEESDPFPVRLWPAQSLPGSPAPEEWVFLRSDLPDASAAAVAAKLFELGVDLSPVAPISFDDFADRVTSRVRAAIENLYVEHPLREPLLLAANGRTVSIANSAGVVHFAYSGAPDPHEPKILGHLSSRAVHESVQFVIRRLRGR